MSGSVVSATTIRIRVQPDVNGAGDGGPSQPTREIAVNVEAHAMVR